MRGDSRRLGIWLAGSGVTFAALYLIGTAPTGHATPVFPYLLFLGLVLVGLGLYLRSAAKTSLLFWRAALRSYASALLNDYDRVPVPFIEREDQRPATRQIYVPLRTLDEYERRLVDDAYARVRNSRTSIVLGPPGSGKSMLLRASILAWAESMMDGSVGQRRTWWTGISHGRKRTTTPVMVELHLVRPADDVTGIIKLIVDSFASHQFIRSERFVKHSLQRGELAILFDGLDEVRTPDREAVSDLVIKFCRRYSDCQVVTTCRSAIYEGQLSELSPEVVRVADFDDAQIRRFLRSWKEKPGGSQTEQLFGVLLETPRLLQLARNPFLLTLMTYLFTQRGDVTRLPRTRAQFYREATSLLLRNKPELSYAAGAKITILQRLALTAQDMSGDGTDRQVLPYTLVIAVIKDVLPSLGLHEEDILPILNEIVNRSGLIKQIRGDQGFHFAHLTLQEFLVAAELADRPEELISRYDRDPSLWGETVKLWCGYVKAGVGRVIDTIFDRDPVLAFECLADAVDVDELLVRKIINYFKNQIGKVSFQRDAIFNAFGAVASDSTIRGNELFGYLVDVARSANDNRRMGAVKALAASKLPKAADAIASLDTTSEVIRQALVSMGDLAIPALLKQVAAGGISAIDDLGAIGTPAAVRELTLLIDRDSAIATRCAWRIASLIRNPDVEETLRDSDELVSPIGSRLDLVWEPFAAGSSRNWQHVMGRVAYLIDNSSDDYVPPRPSIDARIGVPLSAIAIFSWLRHTKTIRITPGDLPKLDGADEKLLTAFFADKIVDEEPKERAADRDGDAAVLVRAAAGDPGAAEAPVSNTGLTDLALSLTDDGFVKLIQKILELYGQRKVHRTLVECSGRRYQRVLISRARRIRRTVALRDWPDSFAPADEPTGMIEIFWILTAVLASGVATAAAIGTYGAIFGHSPWGPNWLPIITLFGFGFGIVLIVSGDGPGPRVLTPYFVTLGALMAVYGIGSAVHYVGWYGVVAAVIIILTITFIRLAIELRKRAVENPMRGLLEIDEQATRNRTSVIAYSRNSVLDKAGPSR